MTEENDEFEGADAKLPTAETMSAKEENDEPQENGHQETKEDDE
jgi:hypothetical protein